MGRRIRAILDYLQHRGSPAGLDDHIRTLSDNDALALDASYGLTRFIIWAIPILGFLGTVLGITEAISGVTPEVLERSLSTVTDGLALAFDTTALGLGLTMVAMLISYLVERMESRVLEAVDTFVEIQLAHRFEQPISGEGQFLTGFETQTGRFVDALDRLADRHAALWGRTLEQANCLVKGQSQRAQEELIAALTSALERTLHAHAARLAEQEKRSEQSLRAIADVIARFEDGGIKRAEECLNAASRIVEVLTLHKDILFQLDESSRLVRGTQESLNQNLTLLAQTGSFEEALHSLTAAVHLLTAKAGPASTLAARSQARPGAAA